LQSGVRQLLTQKLFAPRDLRNSKAAPDPLFRQLAALALLLL
jgi:hypothetical protein